MKSLFISLWITRIDLRDETFILNASKGLRIKMAYQSTKKSTNFAEKFSHADTSHNGRWDRAAGTYFLEDSPVLYRNAFKVLRRSSLICSCLKDSERSDGQNNKVWTKIGWNWHFWFEWKFETYRATPSEKCICFINKQQQSAKKGNDKWSRNTREHS